MKKSPKGTYPGGGFYEKSGGETETVDMDRHACAGEGSQCCIAAVIWNGIRQDAAQENLLQQKTGQRSRRGSAGESFADHPVSMGAEPRVCPSAGKERRRAGGFATRQSPGKQRFTTVGRLKSDYYRWHVGLTGTAQSGSTAIRSRLEFEGGSFHVPQESDVTRFLYLGDVQFQESMEEYEEWGQMVRRAYREHPDLDFAVIGGDLVNSPGELPQWEAFLEACDVFAKLPLATVAGNHEGVHSNYTYQKLFALPDDAEEDQSGEEFYSLDFGNVRMLMMDSSFLTEERRQSMGKDAWAKEEQRVEAWIRSRTGSCEKPWLAAVIHHPVYGMHDEDTVSPQIRRLWAPLLETGGVRIVFSGHQHLYQRTRQDVIQQVVYLMGNSGRQEKAVFFIETICRVRSRSMK